ncbi:MAG: rhomboid family intramembrane serine protease [Bradyrhizobium sp.]
MIPISTTVPTRYPAFVNWTLIAVNCAVFLVQINLPPGELDDFIFTYAFIPARESHTSTPPDFVPFITMMFLHGGWLHLIFNMWTLYLFGPAVEDRLGHGRYLLFYLGCGVAASFAQMATDPSSTVPALGASGAIAGVLGCSMGLFPLSRVIVLIPILFLPLFFELYTFVFIGLWFLLQLLQGTVALLHPAEGGVAWWAHVGGFLAGLLFGPLLLQPERRYRVYQRDEGILGFDAWGRR